MIVNISGTGGAGKSTIVRTVMGLYDKVEAQFVDGRKRPFFYTCKNAGSKELFIPGHYETPCGGCDTWSKYPGYLDLVYEHIREHSKTQDVLYEGLLIESDVRRCAELHQDGFPVHLLTLDVPIELCLASTRLRRLKRGNEKPLNPNNTIARARAVIRRNERLTAIGMPTFRFKKREEALTKCKELLGLTEAVEALTPA